MIGGPALAAIAALRAGAGLARLVTPAPILDAALTIAPSATGRALPVDDAGALVPHLAAEALDAALVGCSCVAIGPGLGVSAGSAALALRSMGQTDRPVVVDADAINALAQTPDFARDCRAPAVWTPHPGEFGRLAGSLGIDADAAGESAERRVAAEALAQRLGAVVVLKGAGTVVTDGLRSWVEHTADAAMATAGTGDVLTGVIAGLVAQWARPGARDAALDLYDCARLGVAAHARAAAIWRAERRAPFGLVAMELADLIPAALATMAGAGA